MNEIKGAALAPSADAGTSPVMRPLVLLLGVALSVLVTHAQNSITPPAPAAAPGMPLWPGPAPGAHGDKPEDIPTLTAYLPDLANRNGASVLILPGGGYWGLAEHEGKGYAEWFVAHGVTSYVLKYRLAAGNYHYPVMIEDATRALRTVRAFAKRDGLDPHRIAIIGSSAGGHLAATILTHFDAGNPNASDPIERESSRPDLGILCYPVITMGQYTHAGSREALLGKNPAPELVEDMSAEKRVTPQTPPTFLWSTDNDPVVPVENSLMFAEALRQHGVPFALHIYGHGPHGLGLGTPQRPAPPWPNDLVYWLKEQKFLP